MSSMSSMTGVVNMCASESHAGVILPQLLDILEDDKEHTDCESVRYCLLAVARGLNHHRLRTVLIAQRPQLLPTLLHFGTTSKRATVSRTAVRAVALLAKSPIPLSVHDDTAIALLYRHLETACGDTRIELWWGLSMFCRDAQTRMTTLRHLAPRRVLLATCRELNIPFLNKIYT